MTTDPVVTVVFFSVGFLAFCGVAAAVCHVLDWRERTEDVRRSRRIKVLCAWYSYELPPAPDYVPEWMEKEAA